MSNESWRCASGWLFSVSKFNSLRLAQELRVRPHIFQKAPFQFGVANFVGARLHLLIRAYKRCACGRVIARAQDVIARELRGERGGLAGAMRILLQEFKNRAAHAPRACGIALL